jgi:hypothetical protein
MKQITTSLFFTVISFTVSAQLRYFEFTMQPSITIDWRDSSFVVATANQSVIDTLLVDMAKPLIDRRHIHGNIASGNGGYNKNAMHNFLWHFDENNWSTQSVSIEVCDGRPFNDVDLDTTYWLGTIKSYCPWACKVSREIFPTAIDKIDFEKTIQLYPIPASDFIVVLGKYGSFKYCIINTTGQELQNAVSTNNKMDVSLLNTGIFFVKIIFDDGSVVLKKIIKK